MSEVRETGRLTPLSSSVAVIGRVELVALEQSMIWTPDSGVPSIDRFLKYSFDIKLRISSLFASW
jgi:hypothetical protein